MNEFLEKILLTLGGKLINKLVGWAAVGLVSHGFLKQSGEAAWVEGTVGILLAGLSTLLTWFAHRTQEKKNVVLLNTPVPAPTVTTGGGVGMGNTKIPLILVGLLVASSVVAQTNVTPVTTSTNTPITWTLDMGAVTSIFSIAVSAIDIQQGIGLPFKGTVTAHFMEGQFVKLSTLSKNGWSVTLGPAHYLDLNHGAVSYLGGGVVGEHKRIAPVSQVMGGITHTSILSDWTLGASVAHQTTDLVAGKLRGDETFGIISASAKFW